MPKQKAKSNKDVYEKAEDLPEGRKKLYDSILEDFDKQVEERIEQMYSFIDGNQKKIKSQFKLALCQQPRNIRSMKVEDLYYDGLDDINLNVECAKVAVTISNSVSDEMKTMLKGPNLKKNGKISKKKSSILAQGPMTGARKSSRKRLANSSVSGDPLTSSTLTAAALGGFPGGFSTIKSTRTKGRVAHLQTPGAIEFGNSMITPKFDPATPLNKTAMRTQRDDEKFLVSMCGSPVYVPGRGGNRAKNDNLIPVPIGGGSTMMVPTDNPEVQKLIKNCMKMMAKKVTKK